MKFAFLGTGHIFPTHLRAIQEVGGEIVGYDTNEDCVVILTPSHLHFQQAMEESKKGKTVLVEKPMALSSADIKKLMKRKNIFTVLQLRYHPILNQIEVKKKNEIELKIMCHRDKKYFDSWKGQHEKSGGIVFNLGIHYFDLLFQKFGYPTKFEFGVGNAFTRAGILRGKNYDCTWIISIETEINSQRRIFKINGTDYDISSKDNLHKFVYQDLMKGKGITPKDILKLTQVVEKL